MPEEFSPSIKPTPARVGAPKSCFVWSGLGLLLLMGVGALTFSECPWIHAITPAAENIQTKQKLDALDERVRTLELRLKKEEEEHVVAPSQSGAPITPPVYPLTENVKALQTQMVQIQTERAQDKRIAQATMALAFAFWDVRSTANEGRNFSAPLAVLQKYTDQNIALSQPLSVLFANASGVETFAQLRDDLAAQELHATVSKDPEKPTWQESAKRIINTLISVHPLHDVVFDPLEHALANGNGESAATDFVALPDDVRKNMPLWQERLKARLAVDAALHEIANTVLIPTAAQEPSP